jgi:hypothetical protein
MVNFDAFITWVMVIHPMAMGNLTLPRNGLMMIPVDAILLLRDLLVDSKLYSRKSLYGYQY